MTDLIDIIDEHSGRVRQKELLEKVGYSKSTLSRELKELEDNDTIVRLPYKTGHVVFKKEQAPGLCSSD